MDGARDQYEEQLKEVFESFDGSGSGSLCSEELTDLCRALQLEDNALNALLHALLQDQLSARVDFEQFRDALILVLSNTNTDEPQKCPEQPDSPEVQPRFVQGGKRYGRRSAPEFIHAHTDLHTQAEDENVKDEDGEEGDDRTVPRKRERWNADLSISEEFEAEGQMHLWNPDEPSTPCSNAFQLSELEERLQNACHELSLPTNGTATLQQLHALCQHIGIELGEDLAQCADGSTMDVQEFVSYIINHNKPPTPSASTPYRNLKRHHSTQFDESGRRISCALSSTIGLQLFSVLDDGSGHVPAETLLYRWMEEGVDNSSEILQALDFNLEDKVNLSELTVALENELLSTKNSIHQAALVSFKAEIRYLLECVELERREKQRIRFDLETAEKLKSQLASEVDDHHAAIERNNEHNLRKLEQEYKESMTTLRTELGKEVELVQQQANQQREELEQEIGKMKEDENFLREKLTLTIKENCRMEAELIDSTEKLVEAENQINKLQKNLDGVLKERFGDLDLDSAEFFQQENRLRQLRRSYEEQCRELQDRIDELEAQLKEFQNLGHTPSTCRGQSLSEELANTSPDPVSLQQQPLNMSLETEMLLEQNQREIESARAMVYEEQCRAEEERSNLSLQHQQEMQVLREKMASELERVHTLEKELSAVHALHRQEISSLTQATQDARSRAVQLEEQLEVLEKKQTAYEEQSRRHADEISLMELKHQQMQETCLQEQRERLQEEREMQEKRLTEQWKLEQECLQKRHEEELLAKLEEVQQRKQQECTELEKRLNEEWERERQALEKSSREALQAMLEERESRLREEWKREKQELEEVSKEALQAVLEERMESERRLGQEWDKENERLEKEHHDVLLQRLEEERERFHAQQEETENIMMEHWERERAQLEKQHEEALHVCLEQERKRLQAEREEQERMWQNVLKEEQCRMEEAHRQAMLELSAKHSEERERLGGLLESLRTDIAQERRDLERQFSQRMKEVEARFCADQEAVSERFQLDVCNLEQHYQSEITALKQQHAADLVHWAEESEAAAQEADQQWNLLKEMLDIKQEKLKMEHQQLEFMHAQEIKALTHKNVQLKAELETCISAAQSKEIELSSQLNTLHDHLEESMEAKDLLMAQAEHKAAELEAMLEQAVEDFLHERMELQKSLSASESRRGEGLALSERMELKSRIQEGEELLLQAAEDFRNERLELKEKLKESFSLLMAKEEERMALLDEKDMLALKVVQLEEMLALLTGTSEDVCTNLSEPCTVMPVEVSADTKEETIKESILVLSDEHTQETNKESTDKVEIQEEPRKHSFTSKNLDSSDEITKNTLEMHFDVRFCCAAGDFVAIDSDEATGKMYEVANPEFDKQQHICPEIRVTEVTISDSCADDKPLIRYETDDVESTRKDDKSSDCVSLSEKKEENEPDECLMNVLNKESDNVESNSVKARDEIDCKNLTKLENIKDKTTVEFEREQFCNMQVSECDHTLKMTKDILLDGTGICGVAFEFTEGIDSASAGKHEESIVNISAEADASYNQKSVQHQESPGSHSSKLTAEPDVPDKPHDDASIARLENQIKDLVGEVCALTLVDMEVDKVADMRSMRMQEILDLQGMAMQYSRAADSISFRLQDLQRGQNITRSYVLPNPCELKASLDTVVELIDLKNSFEQSICENLQLAESNRELDRRVKSLEGKMHIIQDLHKQQASILKESALVGAENCKPKTLLQELKQDKMLKEWDFDISDSSNELNTQLKEKIAAMPEQELISIEIEEQNSGLRQELADLQGKSVRNQKQMQERRYCDGSVSYPPSSQFLPAGHSKC
nr:ninein isoform X1 [Misgurnus anguillicaudatus]XP_055026351.1 ninein isoform X1 [Misgurnus anguillicaudatus]